MKEKQPSPPRWTLPALAAGFAAQAVQIVLLREALVLYQGSELAIGIVLAAWLAGSGAGSLLGGRLLGRLEPLVALAAAGALAAATAIGCVALLRLGPSVWSLPAGAALPLASAATTSLVTAAPGFFVGAQFPALLRLAPRPSAAYAVEAAGSLTAGAALTFVLLRRLEPALLVGIAGAGVVVAAALLRRGWLLLPAAALAAALALLPAFDRALARAAWRTYGERVHPIARAQSPYGPVAAVELGGEVTLYQSGRKRMSLPDRGEATPMAQFVLAQVEWPRRVLLAGGSAAGWLREVLRHPVERVVVLEPDAVFDEIALRYAGRADRLARSDPRVELLRHDGRAYLQAAVERFDVIVLNVGDPAVLATNRYYTREFLRAAAERLEPGGVLALGPVVSYVGSRVQEVHDRNRILYATLRDVWPEVALTPGRTAYLLARAAAPVEFDWTALEARLAPASIEDTDLSGLTDRFAVEAILFEIRTGERFDPLSPGTAVEDLDVPRNTDARPVAALATDLAWGAVEGDVAHQRIAAAVRAGGPWIGVLALLPLVFRPWRSGAARARGVILAAGWCSMAAPLIVLLAFQNAAGTLYEQVALVVAAFMAGSALGAGLSARVPAAARRLAPWALAALTAALGAAFPHLSALAGPAAQVLLPMLAAAAGALGGLVYAAAVEATGGLATAGARLYGLDLAGGAVGGIATSALLLPTLGALAGGLVPAAALALAAAVVRRPCARPAAAA